jgi:parallel beta-helix repeat protein
MINKKYLLLITLFFVTACIQFGAAERIIPIESATHITTQNNIQEITSEVIAQDNLWSSQISPNEAIALQFVENLSKQNDITFVVKNTTRKMGRIEIYETKQNLLIAGVGPISNISTYKVQLSNLPYGSKTFTILVKDGPVKFDWIVDPYQDTGALSQTVSDCGILNTSNAVYTLNQSVTNTRGCFNITASNVVLDCAGFTINYSSNGTIGYGIHVINRNNITIQNCTILEGVATNNGKYAIFMQNSSNDMIKQNRIITSGQSSAIYVTTDSQNSTIVYNNLTMGGANGHGVYLTTRVHAFNISYNNISGAGNPSYGIYLATDCNRSVIDSNNIQETNANGLGIVLSTRAMLNNLTNNVIIAQGNPGYGIYLTTDCNLNKLDNNVINTSNTNGYGIYLLTRSLSNRLQNNTLLTKGTTAYGIYLSGVGNDTIQNNRITTLGSNAYGLYLSSSGNNTLQNNNVNTNQTHAYVILGTVGYHYNNSIDTTNNESGRPINYTFNAQNMMMDLSLSQVNYGHFIFAWGNNITIKNGNLLNSGISLFNVTNSQLINNTIRTNNSDAILVYQGSRGNLIENNTLNTTCVNCFGVYLFTDSPYNAIRNNTIVTSGTGAYGVMASTRVNGTLIENNFLQTINTNAYGIYAFTDSSHTVVRNNVIITNGTGAYGVVASTRAHNTTIERNNILTKNTNAYGAYIVTDSFDGAVRNNLINTTGSGGYGIAVSTRAHNTTIGGNTVRTTNTNGHAIYLTTDLNYTTVKDNLLITNSSGYGLYITTRIHYSNMANNTINVSGSGVGIYLLTTNNHNAFSNTTVLPNGTGQGIYLRGGSDNNTFTNMNIIRSQNVNAFYIYDSSNNFSVIDSLINSTRAGTSDLFINNLVTGSQLWNFTNVSFSDMTWSAGANGTLHRNWYFETYVNDSVGSASDANVTAYNSFGRVVFSLLTNSSGRIPKQVLLEYARNATSGTNFTYYRPYQLSITKAGYSSYTNSTINITTNMFMSINLHDSSPPALSIVYPTAQNYSTNVSELNYTFVDSSGGSSCWYSTNGGAANHSIVQAGMNFTNITSHEGENTWTLYCNDTEGNLNSTAITFYKDTMLPAISLISPMNFGGAIEGTNISFSYNILDASSIQSCSLFVNNVAIATNASINKTNAQFVRTLSIGEYVWHINCTDSLNNQNTSEVRYLSVFPMSTFSGQTTNLSNQNIQNISNFTLEVPSSGLVSFEGTVNLSGSLNFANYVTIRNNYISVDSAHVTQLNRSATIKFYNLNIQKPIVLRDNVTCLECQILSQDNENITFNVPHFTTYTVSENARLTAYDDTDTSILFNGAVKMYGNYTNRTSNAPIVNGACNVAVNNESVVMEYNPSSQMYEASVNFSTAGTYTFNVTCESSGYALLSTKDNIVLYTATQSLSGANVTVVKSERGQTQGPSVGEAYSGNVTSMDLTNRRITDSWQGYFGNISATTFLKDAGDNQMYRWENLNPQGEIYITTSSLIWWSSVQCFNFTADGTYDDDLAQIGKTSLHGKNLTLLEAEYGIKESDVDGVDETFNNVGLGTHDSFSTAFVSFTEGECQSTRLFTNNGQVESDKFEEVLLYEPQTRSVIFTALLENDQTGFDGWASDFEAIVLENGHNNEESTPYYFFVELT